ncbi:hypothetical protein [Kocuria sp. CH-021]|uniref:hypothetical protein n=1 Tax=Kocuria sp. CH-021 TaxID=3406735 RepID=UPI003C74A727
MTRLQNGDHEPEFVGDVYDETVRTHQRHAVKAAALVLAEEYPEAKYIYFEQNGDGERQFDVVGLADSEDNMIEEDMDAYELQIADGAMQLCEVGYAFTPEDPSYVDDVLDEHIKGPTNERFIIIDLEKAAAMDPEAQTEPNWGTRS